MTTLTFDDLRRILVSAAGESDTMPPGADIDGYSFDDLGYDSLAMMETASKITEEYGVRIPDEQVVEFRTPGELLDFVNGEITAEAS